MLLLAGLWFAVFFIFYITGISFRRILAVLIKEKHDVRSQSIDETFFLGLLFIGGIVSISSIFFPIGNAALAIVAGAALLQVFFNFSKIRFDLNNMVNALRLTSKWELGVMLMVAFLTMTIAVSMILPGDTALYYIQNIQWIRHFAVVPGLGNLHGRFAFNSHFLILSSLFSVFIKNTLIFPVNSVCFIVVVFTLYRETTRALRKGSKWFGVFCGVSMLLIIRMLPEKLNTAAPDLICSLLIIYSFFFLIRSKLVYSKATDSIILNLLIFTCVSFKLSSVFLVLLLPFLWKGNVIRQVFLSIMVGAVILLPFLVRNYYLSGYLVYPFPALDIFSVDWKVPLDKVIEEKDWVESWAKIPKLLPSQVVKLSMSEWLPRWFKGVGLFYQILLSVDLLGMGLLVVAYLKKQQMIMRLQLVVLVNLFFWFKMAPDPRFAIGFIAVQFAFILASLLSNYEFFSADNLHFALIVALLVVFVQYRRYDKGFFADSALWLTPAPYVADSMVKVKRYHTNFDYQVPVMDDQCYNLNLPCTPFANDKLMLRGTTLQNGFYIAK
ncbi:LIC_10190 family membrane protein [Hymenobacter antarcticus]|uniref:LIC_10190 family membrane protein n=1 Tax=Hymenobacter antarcticus TaxID=486270 RepID=UPI0031F015E8